jgi:hypothetical protein
LCVEFLLSFDLQIFTPQKMKEYTIQLQKAAQAATMTTRLPASFTLRFPNSKLNSNQG